MLKGLTITIAMTLSTAAHAAEQTTVLHFSNMVCGADPHIIKQSLASVKGVENVEVSLEQASATVSFNTDDVTVAQLVTVVGAAGYPALTQ